MKGYQSLRHFIRILEESGELVRVKAPVSPCLEITEIADRMVKNNGKALLFERTGTQFPLLINAFASERRMCLALGLHHLDDAGLEMERMLKQLSGRPRGLKGKLKMVSMLREAASWRPKSITGRGACQEVIMEKPDLRLLPVLTCWPADGGPFITLPVVHTRDPDTGTRNVGMYRMQVFGPDLTGMHWHMHKGSAHHFERYRKHGLRMPVTVTLGGDPVYTYAATAPLPEQIDEYLFAGFLRKRSVELVRCLTNDLEIPAGVDFVIEGYVDPGEDLILEGPFGDHTGFYSLADYFPKFHVTCITHRKEAVYPATIVGIPPMEDGWIGKATERIFLTPLRMSVVPELVDIHMPVEGVFHNIALVSIKSSYPGQAVKVMNSLWGAGQMMFNKIMVVFDEGTDLNDYRNLIRIIAVCVDPLQDIHFIRGPVDILDHASSRYAYGSKMGIDATTKKDLGGKEPPHESSPILWSAVRKTEPNQVRRRAKEMVARTLPDGVKFVIFTDEEVDHNDLPTLTWIISNQIDPMRDCFYVDSDEGITVPVLFIDGTRKTGKLDGFDREWPNIITMNDETIHLVDKKWDELGIGDRIPSPSLKYKSLIHNEGAIHLENQNQ
jgi:4-hydroxy-3-polyprenylbenzoate decarboxylase